MPLQGKLTDTTVSCLQPNFTRSTVPSKEYRAAPHNRATSGARWTGVRLQRCAASMYCQRSRSHTLQQLLRALAQLVSPVGAR
eukprot:284148-Rhodomonas_salina.1